MVCLYPIEECCDRIKDFQVTLKRRDIFHVAMYRNNQLGFAIKEKDSHQVIELAALNKVSFHSRFDSLNYHNSSLIKVSMTAN